MATDTIAQELEPRSYVNVPTGLNFFVVGLAHSSGAVAPNPSAPIDNARISTTALAIGYAHTFELLGNSAKLDLQTFRACYDAKADINNEFQMAERCEWGDARARVAWNVLGAPALSLEEFRNQYKPEFTLGVSFQIEAPTGDYDPSHIVNAGTNRWMFRPGVGASYRWGDWHVDASLDVKLFDTNDNYLGERVTQDPLYQAQLHVTRYFNRGVWLAFNSNYYEGGTSRSAGRSSNNALDNARLGLTLSWPIGRGHSVKFNASTGVVNRLGTDFNTLGLAYQYQF